MSEALYASVTITPDEAARLQKFNEKRISVEAFVQQILAAGERRQAELLAEGRAIWDELGGKYKLDLEHVSYDYKDGQLRPVMVKL